MALALLFVRSWLAHPLHPLLAHPLLLPYSIVHTFAPSRHLDAALTRPFRSPPFLPPPRPKNTLLSDIPAKVEYWRQVHHLNLPSTNFAFVKVRIGGIVSGWRVRVVVLACFKHGGAVCMINQPPRAVWLLLLLCCWSHGRLPLLLLINQCRVCSSMIYHKRPVRTRGACMHA